MMKQAAWTTMTLSLALASMVHATATQPVSRITAKIDAATRVTLPGNVRPEANARNDLGAVADSMPLNHMQLLLQRSPEQEAALTQAIEAMHDPKSPTYHQWLTAEQFGAQYGVAPSDIATVTAWLTAQGFTVNQVQSNAMTIDFSGTASSVHQAFATEIHRLAVKGAKHFANMSNPQIPAALAPVVRGIVSLNDFRPQPLFKRKAKPVQRQDAASGGNSTDVAPADLATIYNFKPVFAGGNTGQGQTIAVVEDTDIFSAQDWTTFRSTFGLSGYAGKLVQIHPVAGSGGNNCADPGVNANDIEAEVDAEWASAAAPSAKIVVASCADTSTLFGGLIAVQNLVATQSPPSIISISYGECEAGLTTTGNAAYAAAYQQAVAEGISVFVSAGDDGGASCDSGQNGAYNGISVSGMATTPYNVAVGGTDFADYSLNKTASYWSGGAALSYIPEIPWNNSCAGSVLLNFLIAQDGSGVPTVAYGSSGLCNTEYAAEFALTSTTAGSGGPSNCASGTPSTDSLGLVNGAGSCKGAAKPSWQTGVYGIPSDGVRDIPDVSMFAANGLWAHAYIECYSDIANGGSACTGTPDNWTLLGGTSLAAPILAGVQALVNNKTGSSQGNPNTVYYALAAAEYGSGGSATCNSSNGSGVGSTCVFYDVTQGDNVVNCYGYNCYGYAGTEQSNGSINNFTYGVLSTSSASNAPAFKAQTGWDFATGIGTVNVANLVNAWGSQ